MRHIDKGWMVHVLDVDQLDRRPWSEVSNEDIGAGDIRVGQLPRLKTRQDGRGALRERYAVLLRQYPLLADDIYPRLTGYPRHKDREGESRLSDLEGYFIGDHFAIAHPQTWYILEPSELPSGPEVHIESELPEEDLDRNVNSTPACAVHFGLLTSPSDRHVHSRPGLLVLHQE